MLELVDPGCISRLTYYDQVVTLDVWCTSVDFRADSFSIQEQFRRNVKWFMGGPVVKAYRLVYHSTLGSRVKKK